MSIVKDFIQTVQKRYETANPFKIAEILNIDVRYCYLGRMPLGKTNYDDKGAIIILNDSLRDSPQKYFTLAHELGHYFMHEGLAGYYTGVRFGYDEFEKLTRCSRKSPSVMAFWLVCLGILTYSCQNTSRDSGY